MRTFIALLLTILSTFANGASITLAWDANTDGVTTQYVLYKTVNGVTSAVSTVAHPTITATTARELPGTTASYYVTAKSAQGLESGPSNVVVDNVPAALPLPSAVANLQGTVSVVQGVVTQTLSWSANSAAEAVTQYVVRRYDANNVMVQSMTSTGTAVQMTYTQATMRTDVVAVNATGAGPVRSYSVVSPKVPGNARITVIN